MEPILCWNTTVQLKIIWSYCLLILPVNMIGVPVSVIPKEYAISDSKVRSITKLVWLPT